jgi:hypothetical protein
MAQARAVDGDFKGLTTERCEFREGGHYHEAKLIVLRNLWLKKKGLPLSPELPTRNSPIIKQPL